MANKNQDFEPKEYGTKNPMSVKAIYIKFWNSGLLPIQPLAVEPIHPLQKHPKINPI